MNIRDVLQSILDKVVIGTIAAIVSLLALQGYNSHLKEIENAQPLTRSMSDVAVKKKEELLASIQALISISNGVMYKLPKYSKTDQDAAIRSHIAEIAAARNMLGVGLADTNNCFKRIESQFDTKIKRNYDPPGKSLRMDAESFSAFLQKITELQDECVKLFNHQLAGLLSEQDRDINEVFYKNSSWYERPGWLLMAALAAAVIAVGFSVLMSRLSGEENDSYS